MSVDETIFGQFDDFQVINGVTEESDGGQDAEKTGRDQWELDELESCRFPQQLIDRHCCTTLTGSDHRVVRHQTMAGRALPLTMAPINGGFGGSQAL